MGRLPFRPVKDRLAGDLTNRYVRDDVQIEMAMSYVSMTELRANIATHLDRVLDDRSDLVITRQNREPVVILPLAELESLRETLYLLSTPANAQRLLESMAQLERGEGVPFEFEDQ